MNEDIDKGKRDKQRTDKQKHRERRKKDNRRQLCSQRDVQRDAALGTEKHPRYTRLGCIAFHFVSFNWHF